MIAQGLTDYNKTQKKEIRKQLQIAQNKLDEEAIHEMRVAIKKTRAVFLAAKIISNGKIDTSISLKEINKLFKYAGHVRDVHVMLIRIDHYEDFCKVDLSNVIYALEAEKEIVSMHFEDFLTDFDFKVLNSAHTTLKHAFNTISDNKIFQRLNSHMKMIHQKIYHYYAPDCNDEHLHKVRRYVKQLMYLITISNKYIIKEKFLKVHVNPLKHLGELLGDWHDITVLRNRILKIAPTYATITVLEQLHHEEKKLRKEIGFRIEN